MKLKSLLLISLLWLLGSLSLQARQPAAGSDDLEILLSPEEINQETGLQYHLAFSTTDAIRKKYLVREVGAALAENGWNITITEPGRYPDLIFIADGDASVLSTKEGWEAYGVQLQYPSQEIIDCQEVIPVKNSADATEKVIRFLKKFYYSGMRPVYSTVYSQADATDYNGFRIPSVLTTASGRVLAFSEARGISKTDCAENDIVVRYSDDEGKTWSPLVMVADGGESSYNNPTSVYVEEINRIIVLFQEYPPKLYEGSVHTGMEGEGITRCHMVYSDDNGETWSEKEEITRQVKLPEAAAYATGPGAAIRVTAGPDKGRILVPVNVAGGDRGWFNYLFASDDLGASWFILPGHSDYGTNESQVVQVGENEFVVNARSHRYHGTESLAPQGWDPWRFGRLGRCRTMIPVDIQGKEAQWHATELRYDLPDPVCQGAIYRYSGLAGKEKSRLLFVNAASNFSECEEDRFMWTSPMRVNGVVRVSYDEGRTWTHSRRIYGNRYTSFQYSVLTRLKSGRIACLFETGSEIRMAVFDLKWLTGGEDK